MTLDSVESLVQAARVSPVSATNDSTAKAPAVAKSPEDKVEVSVAAQAKLLKHQGQSVAQIASSLALTTKTVDDYLGITESTSAGLNLAALVQTAGH
jgi:hypothetical protein